MRKHWKRLPGSHTEPAGMERSVLRKLPIIAIAGTLACFAVSLFVRLLWWGDTSVHTARAIQMVDIWVIAAILLQWSVTITVAIFCFIVFVMKGPAYIADPYELPDKDEPD